MLDENEFLSPYGIRSLSKYHLEHPFVFDLHGQEYKVQYLPAESNTGMFGGNSNWRGPVWIPMNALLIRGLLHMYPFYGPDFKVECPTGSGRYMTLFEVAKEIGQLTVCPRSFCAIRMASVRSMAAPRSSRTILILEGLHTVLRILPWRQRSWTRRSHQTGWTGSIARSLDLFARLDPVLGMEAPTNAMADITRKQAVAGT